MSTTWKPNRFFWSWRSPVIGDDDEGLGAAGQDLFLGQASAAAFDERQPAVHLVGAVDHHVQLNRSVNDVEIQVRQEWP